MATLLYYDSMAWRLIFRTNAGWLSIGTYGSNFSEIPIEIQTFSLRKMDFKISFWKWRPFCIMIQMSLLFQEANSNYGSFGKGYGLVLFSSCLPRTLNLTHFVEIIISL